MTEVALCRGAALKQCEACRELKKASVTHPVPERASGRRAGTGARRQGLRWAVI